MKFLKPALLLTFLFLYSCKGDAIKENTNEETPLSNPFTSSFLTNNLREDLPRLVLNEEIDQVLRTKLKTDPVVQNIYEAIKRNADQVMQKPFLERIKIGRRLLSVSREMLYRINMLGMAYHVDKDPMVLKRIEGELKAVCSFSDWNPTHYLDVGEMSMAVAFALDWTAGALPDSTKEQAINALRAKGINPSYETG